jgi:hypothetical protein
MQWFIYLLLLVYSYYQWKNAEGPSSDPTTFEDLNRPTVSQSRAIPVVFGTRTVSGPNVQDSGNLRTKEIKMKVKGMFGSKSVGTGQFRHYLDELHAIAWGPGTLKEIWFGDFQAWTGSVSTSSQITINKLALFGDPDTDGGVAGTIDILVGTDTQTPSAYMETRLGHNQPGYPGVGLVAFRDFYFGNAPTFKPVSYVWQYLPNPFSHVDNFDINGAANPALCLYLLYTNDQYGLDLDAIFDVASFQTVAQTIKDEGAGYSRAWYSGEGSEIEDELLSHMNAVRYRHPTTGAVTLKLLRDDYTIGTLDELTATNISTPPMMTGNELTTLATELKITYLDRANADKNRTLTLPNLANRLQLGRRHSVERDYYGAPDATIARKLSARDGKQVFYPLESGQVVTDRTAWDWTPGKVFKLSYAPMGLVQAIMRVVKVRRGSLSSGAVVLDVIEDAFAYGSTVFDAPLSGGINSLTTDPVDATNYLAFELPVFLIEDETPQKLGLLVEKPSGDSTDFMLRYEVDNGGFKDDRTGSFADAFLVDAAVSETATTIVVQGELSLEPVSASEIAINGSNMLVLETAGGMEFIAAESVSYSSGTDKTTLSNVHRGLLDTHPKAVASLDTLWALDSFVFSDSFADTDVVDFKVLTHTGRGELAEGSATERSHTIAKRYEKPLPPADVDLNASYFPAVVTGPVTANWSHRDASATTSIIDWDDATNYGPEAGTTYTVTWYNHDTSGLLQQTTGITGTSDTWTDTGQSYNLRCEIKSVKGGVDSHETLVHVTSFSQA